MTIHDSDRDFDQFRHFDRPVSLSTATLSTLRHRLASSSEALAITTSSPAMPAARLAAEPHSTNWPKSGFRQRIRSWQIAAAVLAILLAASTLVISLQPEEPTRLAFQPGPTAERDVNPAGTIGRTWQVGDQNPVVGSPVRTNTTLDQLVGLVPLIAGDSVYQMYAEHTPERSTLLLVRLNIETGKRIWEQPIPLMGVMASNETHLFALRAEHRVGVDSGQLVAIDIDTGEIVWEGPSIANRSINPSSVIVDGDTVFAIDYLGNVVSVNAATGSLNWQFPEQFRAPTESEDGNQTGLFRTPIMAADDDSIFFVRPSQSVARIERATGQETSVINVLDHYASSTQWVDLAVSDSYLIVSALNPSEFSVSSSTSYQIMPTELLIFDLETLDMVGRSTVADVRGNIAVRGDTAFVPMSDGDPIIRTDNGWNPRSRVDAIDLTTMTVTSQLTGFDGKRSLPLSLAGKTLIVPGALGTIEFYDVVTLQLTHKVTIDLPPSEFDFRSPVLMDGVTPIVVGSIGEVYLLNGPPHAATPEAIGTPVP